MTEGAGAGLDMLSSCSGPVGQLRPSGPSCPGEPEVGRREEPGAGLEPGEAAVMLVAVLTPFSSPSWVPAIRGPRSGHCYYQTVVTPVIEQILPDSPGSRLPHTVTLVSIPASAHGRRGLSVSIDPPHGPPGCSTEHSHTVRVQG